MDQELAPTDISSATFRQTFRGVDPGEVRAFLQRLATQVEELIAQRDRLAARLGEYANRDLRAEFEAVSLEVGEVLEASRQAAEGLRERATTDAARWRGEALAEAEAERRAAADDAVRLRTDAWTTGEQLLNQAMAEARRIREAAERDSLTVLGGAEREAHRLTAAARRESEDLLRTARSEAERMQVEAGSRHDEIIEQARRQAEAAQERARALEQRRQELMGELESLRSTLSRMEGELDERRQRLGLSPPAAEEVQVSKVVFPPGPDEETHRWTPGETVRVIPKPKPVPTETVPDADQMADEVRRIRATHPAMLPVEESTTPETEEEPPPAPEPQPAEVTLPAEQAPEEASEPESEEQLDSLGDLFQRLRSPQSDYQPPSEGAPTAEGEVPVAEDGPTAGEVPVVAAGMDPFDLRDRLLLPITNRVLRNLKRQLTEVQNLALEELRVREGKWEPSPTELEAQLGPDLRVLTAESFAAGHAAAEEMVGERFGRPLAPAGDEAPAFAAALRDDLVAVLGNGDQGVRNLSAGVSRVFRAWRADESERRVHDLAQTAYHQGLQATVEGSSQNLGWLISGRGCATCRAAAEEAGQLPPAHPGCGCTVAPLVG